MGICKQRKRSEVLEAASGSVTCRSNGVGYAAGIMLLIYGVGINFLAAGDGKHLPLPLLLRLGIGAIFSLGAVLLICWERLAHITANQEGLGWRTFCKTRHARWDEVTDYYDTAVSRGQTQQIAVVRTTSGSIRLNSQWKNTEAVRAMVQRFAVRAPVTDWEVIGTRVCDPWPRTFDYYPKAQKWLLAFQIVIAVGFLYASTFLIWHWMQETFAILGPRYVVGMFCLFTLLSLPLSVCLFFYLCQTAITLRRHGTVVIEVTPQVLRFASRGSRLSVLWSDVGGYHIETKPFVESDYVLCLRGSDETQIRWNRSISGCQDLAHIVRKYAPRHESEHDGAAGWRTVAPPPATGRFRSVTARFAARGERRFHYRTGELFPMLLGATVLLVCTSMIPLLYSFLSLSTHFDAVGMTINNSAAGLALLYGWWRYFVGGIEIDDFWITQRTLFGNRRLLWAAVSDYKGSSSPYVICGQTGKPIVFWAGISQMQELKAEIERRSPSPKTGWGNAALPAKARTVDQGGGYRAGRAKRCPDEKGFQSPAEKRTKRSLSGTISANEQGYNHRDNDASREQPGGLE